MLLVLADGEVEININRLGSSDWCLRAKCKLGVPRSDVLVSIVGCVVVDGDQAVQELVWALLQAQQAIVYVLDLVARDRPILDHGEVLPHQRCFVNANRHKLRVKQFMRHLIDLSIIG